MAAIFLKQLNTHSYQMMKRTVKIVKRWDVMALYPSPGLNNAGRNIMYVLL